MKENIVSQKIYGRTFFALLGLLGLTVGVSYIHFGILNPIIALLIASLKALLILLYFMHVRYYGKLIWIFVGIGFFWLTLLVVLSLTDYLTRK
ncbi:MAG: cytochrome C oxidase subunit IV family protein [Verrucomicrobiae bacterium]|nr:cytochrome C oxidase subunit IV family protein [Verrucomicrobiae bacterium]